MNAMNKYYLKAFLWTGIPFALIMTLFDLFEGEGFNVVKFLFHAVFFGGVMSIFLVSMHKSRLRKKGITEFTADNLKVLQLRVVKSKTSIEELASLLRLDSNLGKMKYTRSENEINLSSRVSWYSWGEKIQIKKLSSKNGEFEYEIQSKPIVSTTLVDYGKNLENVNRIEALLSNID